MAPMAPTYDRLEAGHPPSKQPESVRFGWKKFVLGAGVLLILVWLYVPRVQCLVPLPGWGGSPISEKGNTPYQGKPSRPSADHADEDIRHPHSFETDRDPTKTTYCTHPHSSSARLVQYALVIDVGSTGSRIHIYKFNNCGPSPVYEYETFKMTRKPLHFFGRPVDAAASLDVLMDEALRVVPEPLQKRTPVAVRATAGLRLLPGSRSADILDAVATRLRDKYPFALPGEDAVTIMDGVDAAVFAWVTANYLLGTLGHGAPEKTSTYAVLDLGGGITQIVFAPANGALLLKVDNKYDLEFAGRHRDLYQHSYLGYGLMRARASVHRVVSSMATLQTSSESASSSKVKVIANPCLSRGTQRTIELRVPMDEKVIMDGADTGEFDACARVVDSVLAKDAVCAVRPCAFGGVPALAEAFPATAGRVLLLGYFYDRVSSLMPTPKDGEELTATVATFKELAQAVCKGREEWLVRWGAHPHVMRELEERPEWCLDLTFMHGLLKNGYGFEGDREVMFGKQIPETEVGWFLGAAFKLIGAADVQSVSKASE